MTKDQRGFVRYWAFGGGILAAAIGASFMDVEHQQAAQLGIAALFGVVSLFQDFSYYSGYGSAKKRLGEFIEFHPRLKVWLVGYSAVALPYLIYEMQTNEEVSGVLYFTSFLLLIGPIVFVSEVERFRSMGNNKAEQGTPTDTKRRRG
ncbi:MAG: hypothetical protein ACWGOW_09730 [Gammaproteobacteria bacterium]